MPEETLEERFPDAFAAYQRAVADAEFVRAAWVEAGRPIVADHANGSCGVSPLFKSVGDAETIAARLRSELGLSPKSAKAVIHRRPGRPVGSVSAPDRVRARPGVQLRSVD